jgi:hypothetical protein
MSILILLIIIIIIFWILWDFIHFTIISVCYCAVVKFWKSHVVLFFHISHISALGFVHLRQSCWLEVLMTCSLSVKYYLCVEQCSSQVEVLYLTLDLVYGLGHQAWFLEAIRLRKSNRSLSLSPLSGVWTQGFTLAGQVLYHWVTVPALFYVGYFWDRVLWTICLG